MDNVKIKTSKKYTIQVIPTVDQRKYISKTDIEMDERAVQAVKVAIEKAKFCKKPVSKYDMNTKEVYIEYADGKKEYVR